MPPRSDIIINTWIDTAPSLIPRSEGVVSWWDHTQGAILRKEWALQNSEGFMEISSLFYLLSAQYDIFLYAQMHYHYCF